MNPLELRLKNYRTFESLDLELPAGVAAIIGENGAGKSSLVNGIDLALFGPDGRSWAPYLTQGIEDTELLVELVFEHAGETYRARRGYSARGAGKTTLDLEKRNGVGWLPATREGQRATQESIEELVGLSRETFRASAFLKQRDGGAFTEVTASKRKEVLSKVLGLDRFDGYLADVKTDRNDARSNVERLKGALDRADQELTARPELEQRLATSQEIASLAEKALEKAQAQLEAAAVRAQEIEKTRTAAAEAGAAVAAASGILAPLEQRVTDADGAAKDLAVCEDELGTLAPLEQRVKLAELAATLDGHLEKYRQAIRDRDEAQRIRATRESERAAILAQAAEKGTRVAQIEDRIHELEVAAETGAAAHCDLCKQMLADLSRGATIETLKTESGNLSGEMAALRDQAERIDLPEIPAEPEPPLEVESELATVKTALEKARADELQRERLTGRTGILRERVAARPDDADIDTARRALAEARTAADALPPAATDEDLSRIQAEALTARASVEEERIRHDAAKADSVRAETELARLAEIEKTTATDRTERERLLGVLDRLAVLERAYGRDGIPALIIQGAAIPAIETDANRILAELGGSTASARVELRTEKALKDGTAADALDVIIITDRGERPYETFSEGEKTRLNLALRIALARLLATRRGAESRVLVVDEPEFLDEAGTAALARVLQGLTGDFERVYLISHVPDLRSAFDQTLEVVKNGDGFSRIAS